MGSDKYKWGGPCKVCGRTSVKRCAVCGRAFYCSLSHQLADKAHHDTACKPPQGRCAMGEARGGKASAKRSGYSKKRELRTVDNIMEKIVGVSKKVDRALTPKESSDLKRKVAAMDDRYEDVSRAMRTGGAGDPARKPPTDPPEQAPAERELEADAAARELEAELPPDVAGSVARGMAAAYEAARSAAEASEEQDEAFDPNALMDLAKQFEKLVKKKSLRALDDGWKLTAALDKTLEFYDAVGRFLTVHVPLQCHEEYSVCSQRCVSDVREVSAQSRLYFKLMVEADGETGIVPAAACASFIKLLDSATLNVTNTLGNISRAASRGGGEPSPRADRWVSASVDALKIVMSRAWTALKAVMRVHMMLYWVVYSLDCFVAMYLKTTLPHLGYTLYIFHGKVPPYSSPDHPDPFNFAPAALQHLGMVAAGVKWVGGAASSAASGVASVFSLASGNPDASVGAPGIPGAPTSTFLGSSTAYLASLLMGEGGVVESLICFAAVYYNLCLSLKAGVMAIFDALEMNVVNSLINLIFVQASSPSDFVLKRVATASIGIFYHWKFKGWMRCVVAYAWDWKRGARMIDKFKEYANKEMSFVRKARRDIADNASKLRHAEIAMGETSS